MMERTGGGFLKSHGMKDDDLPEARAPKQMPAMPPMQPAPQNAPQGQPMPPPQGGQGGGMLPPVDQGMPPDQGGMPPEQGMPPDGFNDVANNALMILHDEESGAAIDDMIAQGPDGAAEVLYQIYNLTVQGYQQAGQEMNPDMADEAVEAVLEDVFQIGESMGSLKGVEDKQRVFSKALSMIAKDDPEVAQGLQEIMSQASEEDIAQGQSLAQGGQQAPQGGMPPQQGGMM